jgi:hypothetical protein
MSSNFKKLSISSAVAVATATLAGMANSAVTTNGDNAGDAAIIPYYNVADGYVTGVHLINTAAGTTAVKVRLRQRADSEDVLDFNVVLSPHDVWTGLIKADPTTGAVTMTSSDTTCTVPLMTAAGLTAGLVADEGYVEILSMGHPLDENEPVAKAAKHANGVPNNCEFVKDNFKRANDSGASWAPPSGTTPDGVWDINLTGATGKVGTQTSATFQTTRWVNATNTLKVSWFMREADAGWEIGGNAQHLVDFLTVPSMSNQSSALSGRETYADPLGFDYPNMNGGSVLVSGAGTSASIVAGGFASASATGANGTYDNELGERDRLAAMMGSGLYRNSASNDWVYKVGDGTEITSDWVVTFPGQINLCEDANDIGPGVEITMSSWDREEATYVITPEDDIVVSPAPPGAIVPTTTLDEEVNVLRVSDEGSDSVGAFDNAEAAVVSANGFESGWARLTLEGNAGKYACDYSPYEAVGAGKVSVRYHTKAVNTDPTKGAVQQNMAWNKSAVATDNVLTLGYAAWKKVRADEPGANYGRAVEHTWTGSGYMTP